MHDRRVVRGSSHAMPIVPPSVLAEQAAMEMSATKLKNRKDKERKAVFDAEARARALEVPPVTGRNHSEVSTGEGRKKMMKKDE